VYTRPYTLGNVKTVTPRQLLPRSERRETILRAAALAFAVKGFAATSMEDVAAEAGITKLIVYRHFGSKEELYEAVLDRVSNRLAEEFVAGVAGMAVERGAEVGVRSLLTVAREDSDGFVLLWRHAVREPQFADHALRFREQAVVLARSLLDHHKVGDPVRRRWAAELIISWLVDAVIHWLEEGEPSRDEEFVRLVGVSLRAMVRAWGEAPR
jgi:AcrR family transcriptional regulator